jgi:hypothetical protein
MDHAGTSRIYVNLSKGSCVKVMTKEEAINVLDGFRKALMALDPTMGRQAFSALIDDTGIVSTAMQRAAEAGNALQTLRRAFQEIEGKGIRFSSN